MCIIFTAFVTPLTDIKDLVYVRRALRTVLKWKELGLYLGLHISQLETIKMQQQGNIDYCTMEVLATWLNMTHSASLSTLRAALKKIGMDILAEAIPTDGELAGLHLGGGGGRGGLLLLNLECPLEDLCLFDLHVCMLCPPLILTFLDLSSLNSHFS